MLVMCKNIHNVMLYCTGYMLGIYQFQSESICAHKVRLDGFKWVLRFSQSIVLFSRDVSTIYRPITALCLQLVLLLGELVREDKTLKSIMIK